MPAENFSSKCGHMNMECHRKSPPLQNVRMTFSTIVRINTVDPACFLQTHKIKLLTIFCPKVDKIITVFMCIPQFPHNMERANF